MNETGSRLEARLAALPDAPGVYLFKDAKQRVVYVGKARSLKQRVRSYFNTSRGDGRVLLPFLRARIDDFDILQVGNEKEALLLENTLIKHHKPKYNVRLVDDKTYLSLRLDRRHRFPRFTTARRRKNDGARYFGPYSSARSIRHTLKLIYRAFGVRSCSDAVLANRTRPCLYHQIGQCLAPCVDLVSPQEYAKAVDRAALLLDGRSDELLGQLREDMLRHAEAERYEEAAQARDAIRAVDRSLERQNVAVDRDVDFDVVGHARSATDQGRTEHVFVWLEVRDGRIMGSSTTRVRDPEGAELPRLLTTVLSLVYEQKPVPAKVLVPSEPETPAILEQILGDRRGARVEVRVATRGLQRRLIGIASANATSALAVQSARGEQNSRLLDSLAELLELPRRPRRIECFDISNLSGTLAVASMAVALDGEPAPAQYRHYRIKQAAGDDDYAGMREVLSRRLARALDGGDLPDLILVDGGAGQLQVALSVIEELGVSDTPVIGVAKGPDRNAGRETIHRSQLPVLTLPTDDPRLHLLQRVRDEAHRFAISYNRRLRSKRDRKSRLDDIPGMGPKRIKRLLQTFGSIDGVRLASVEELAAVPGVGRAVASRVHAAVRRQPER